MVLSLQQNSFVGPIPQEITQLTKLLTLNISWNSLSGSIPSSVSNLANLQFLHLQENNLTGSIPASIGSMNNLIELQLGKNYLSGQIASVPRNLQYSLNLSHNQFDGPIPNSLSLLSSLQVLDLSYNRFSGPIPNFSFDQSLVTLLLNNNSLSGVRPKFSSNVVVDTDGNPGLRTLPPDSVPVSVPVFSHRKTRVRVKIAVEIGGLLFGGIVGFFAVWRKTRVRVINGHLIITCNNSN
ncbi:hypothetical protein RND81_01G214000 [Saponaria officinalis]|uniref:Uncharacterized protein n=1 Tax=Saponaria officinalis TaxID=3572 RepID=A0AAW1N8X6_SAPOF